MTLTRVPDLDTLSLLLEIAASGSLSKAGASRGLSLDPPMAMALNA